MAGWIRSHDYRLVNANRLDMIRIARGDGNKETLYTVVGIDRDDSEVYLSERSDLTTCEEEIDRLTAWLNDGAQGVYVIGEGPMGRSSETTDNALYAAVELLRNCGKFGTADDGWTLDDRDADQFDREFINRLNAWLRENDPAPDEAVRR